jgi:hypothetical protein
MIGSMNFNTDFMKMLITKYRHPNFTIFFTSQYIKSLPPVLENAHLILFVLEQLVKCQQKQYKNHL